MYLCGVNVALSGHNDRAFSRSYLLLKLDTSPLVMSKNAHVMGILYSIIGAYHICWRGHLLIRRWAVQTSKEEPSR